MQIILTGDADQLTELDPSHKFIWVENRNAFQHHPEANAFVDLGFDNSEDAISALASLFPRPVIVNSVINTLADSHPGFIRFNGWKGFLAAPVIEASAAEPNRPIAESVFAEMGKSVRWVPDQPGFVSPRVIASIILEAMLAKDEGVSSDRDINLAMRLGTNYPFGPFEWMELLGEDHVKQLIVKLGK